MGLDRLTAGEALAAADAAEHWSGFSSNYIREDAAKAAGLGTDVHAALDKARTDPGFLRKFG